MCIFSKTPAAAAPQLPVEYAAQRAPSVQAAKEAGKTAKDKVLAAAPTMLTGAEGVGAVDATGKKTLLGA